MLASFSFRLMIWYTALFAALSITVFGTIYEMLKTNLNQRMDQSLVNEARECEAIYRHQGVDALAEEFHREAESEGIKRVFFRLISPHPSQSISSDLSGWPQIAALTEKWKKLKPNEEDLETISFPGQDFRTRIVYLKSPDGSVIQAGYSIKEIDALISHYRIIFGLSTVIMLFCGGAIGWYVSKKAMRGIERITNFASHIGRGDFTKRIPLDNDGKEITELALAFNKMLERIMTLVNELTEVTNGIAHDIRSPLTRIRGVAEMTLLSPWNREACQEMVQITIEECDRLIGMVNTTLEIAETESSPVPLAQNMVDLTELAMNAYELFQPLAEDKNIDFTIALPEKPIHTLGDVRRLQRALANLIDNAIKYTPQGGSLVVSLTIDNSHVRLAVTDSGVGIRPDELPHIFERFYRGDKSRSTPGSGLGLSLAQTIIRAHHGEIAVSSSPGKGTSFTIILSLADDSR